MTTSEPTKVAEITSTVKVNNVRVSEGIEYNNDNHLITIKGLKGEIEKSVTITGTKILPFELKELTRVTDTLSISMEISGELNHFDIDIKNLGKEISFTVYAFDRGYGLYSNEASANFYSAKEHPNFKRITAFIDFFKVLKDARSYADAGNRRPVSNVTYYSTENGTLGVTLSNMISKVGEKPGESKVEGKIQKSFFPLEELIKVRNIKIKQEYNSASIQIGSSESIAKFIDYIRVRKYKILESGLEKFRGITVGGDEFNGSYFDINYMLVEVPYMDEISKTIEKMLVKVHIMYTIYLQDRDEDNKIVQNFFPGLGFLEIFAENSKDRSLVDPLTYSIKEFYLN